MKNLKFSAWGGSFLSLLILVVFAVGCSMDGEVQDLNLKDSDQLSKIFNSVDKDPKLIQDFKVALEESKLNKQPQLNSEAMLKSNKVWANIVNAGGSLNTSTKFFSGYYLSFQAKESSEGIDVGTIEFKNEEGEVVGSGIVDCLYVYENQAYIRFVVGPTSYYMGFEDNGEGSNADPDQFSDTYISLFGTPPCEDFSGYLMSINGIDKEWSEGNVQIQ